jgi:ADP-ribosyl-[dinitrogen reductase] hydrolase
MAPGRGGRTIMDLSDRYRGAMFGLAAGDALGTTLEFRHPGSFVPLTDIVGGGPFGLDAGQWTDDTSLALCLAESLVTLAGFDPVHQLETFTRWYRHGHLSSTGRCFDIGNTTREALHRFEETRMPFPGPADAWSAGNGSIMRLAPVPLAFAPNAAKAITLSGDSSRTTHGAAECVDACRYLGGLIVGAVRGVPKDELLSPGYCPVPGLWEREPLSPKIADIAAGSFKTKMPPEIRGTGYVVQSLEAALWAFFGSSDFRAGALLAVNLGDDADTTGAVYGQLAGAFYGASGIPEEWRNKLAFRELICELADGLLQLDSLDQTA